MSEWESPLVKALGQRIAAADDDDMRAVLNFLAGYRPTDLVKAFEYATRLREEVEETLRG